MKEVDNQPKQKSGKDLFFDLMKLILPWVAIIAVLSYFL